MLNLGWKKWTAIAVIAAVLLGAGLFLAFGTSHTIERSDRDAGENIYMVVKPGTTASESQTAWYSSASSTAACASGGS